MRVLVACERSGILRTRLVAAGHDAWSCDLVAADDGSPRHHVGDALELLDEGWDLLVAHPPCNHLSVLRIACHAGRCVHLACREHPGLLRLDTIEAARVFWRFRDAPVPRVAVENTLHHPLARRLCGPPAQTVHPWWFGDGATKATCWWLRGLPQLTATRPVRTLGRWISGQPGGQPLHPDAWRSGDDDGERARRRAQSWPGMADAIVAQWTDAPDPHLFDL